MSFWFYLARLLVLKPMSTPSSGCSKPAICGHNPFGFSFFSLLSSPRWLNTVIGDESELTSQLISNSSLPTQPMKGCTTQPRSTLEWMIFWEGFPKISSQPFNRKLRKCSRSKSNGSHWICGVVPFTNKFQKPSSKYETAGLSDKFSNLFSINLFIYCVFIKFLAFSRSTNGICGIACTNTTKKKEQYALRHISSFFLFASL